MLQYETLRELTHTFGFVSKIEHACQLARDVVLKQLYAFSRSMDPVFTRLHYGKSRNPAQKLESNPWPARVGGGCSSATATVHISVPFTHTMERLKKNEKMHPTERGRSARSSPTETTRSDARTFRVAAGRPDGRTDATTHRTTKMSPASSLMSSSALERRVRALETELASRDAMLHAVQEQAKSDTRAAFEARDDAVRAMETERAAKLRAMDACAEVRAEMQAMEAEMEAARASAGERTKREVELREALERATERLQATERAIRAAAGAVEEGENGELVVAPTPGKSPSAMSFRKKIAAAEARCRNQVAAQRREILDFLHRERRGVGGGVCEEGEEEENDDNDEIDDGETPAAGSSGRNAALEWGIARSEGLDALLELVSRVSNVLERAIDVSSTVDVDDEISTDDDEEESRANRKTWADAAREFRNPDAELERLAAWLTTAADLVSGDELRAAMSRACAATHKITFALKRACVAAADGDARVAEAFSVADEAAQIYRLHLAQAESRASMAERRASAAEDAMQTMSALCSDARRDAEAASRAAERDRRELRRRESELAMRRALASSSENPEHPLVSPLKPTVIAATPVRTHRPMAPFPTPPRDSAVDSPALAELQNLRRSLERFDDA